MGVTNGQFELRLQDTRMPAGEIDLRDLANLGGRLQDLATRVGRWVAGIDRPGRSTANVEETVVLRLTGVRPGSTVLELTRGPSSILNFPLAREDEFDQRFWETIAAIGSDAPRIDTPPLVRASATGLLDALEHAAQRVVFSRPDGARVAFRPADRSRTVWVHPVSVEEHEMTMSGVVTMVDLDSHRFRLHDDVGNRIPLEGIDDTEVARVLLDRRADATGLPRRDPRGRVMALVVTSITASKVPAEWTQRVHDDTWKAADVPGPDPDGGVVFTEDEWTTFMAAVRGE